MEQTGLFETAAAPHLDDLFRAAVCLLGNAPDAEQAVERATRRALKNLGTADPAIGVRAWLFRNVLDEVRRCRRMALRFRFNALRGRASSSAPPRTHDSPTGTDALSALQSLPAHVAEVVLLVDAFDFSVGHAQETLGFSSHAIADHLREGRRLLVELLDGEPAAIDAGTAPDGDRNSRYLEAGAIPQ